MNAAEVARLLLQVSNLWDRFDVSADDRERLAMVEDWAEVLADVDAGEARAAVTGLAGERFPPKAGLIRERALTAAALARGETVPPDADEAWTEIGRAIRTVGHMGYPAWSHQAVAESVEAMGWRVLCMSDEGDVAVRAQWRSFYDLARGRALRRLAPPPPMAALGAGRRELGR